MNTILKVQANKVSPKEVCWTVIAKTPEGKFIIGNTAAAPRETAHILCAELVKALETASTHISMDYPL